MILKQHLIKPLISKQTQEKLLEVEIICKCNKKKVMFSCLNIATFKMAKKKKKKIYGDDILQYSTQCMLLFSFTKA